ncbi:HEAT repeat domain-containing protein [Fimbriiglobus ruber]|uniref:HEAT repeat protein n=1 Tax=Fimbriiglobus ruber TaxID=1908690 RepID=A0A225DKE1_9BACT|nr:HEAT repeat domain-containing protein [Fimbriiglobus ruber]OWK37659.1 hypothetical protein FRUB_06779 [Fimbriiglobus ruber]
MSTSDITAALGSIATRAASLVVLTAPAALLGVTAARYQSGVLAAGAVAVLIIGLLFVRTRAAWRPPTSGTVILLYLMGLGWLWFATREYPDAFIRAARGAFVVAAVALAIGHDLVRTGLEPRRRAVKLCRRVLARVRWPQSSEEYANLPEVRALRGAVQDDPGPVLELLNDPRPEVRATALAALAGREYWRPGEAAAVAAATRDAIEPAVRITGLYALATATDPASVAVIAACLHDPIPEVRRAAGETVMTGGAPRWPLVRDGVRGALADSTLASDGALAGTAGRLPPIALCDLATWAVETEPLATRAVKTVIAHFGSLLCGGQRPELPAEIGAQILDPQTPPAMRVGLAGLLRGLGMLSPDLLDRMTDIDQPGPIRLLAAEEILTREPGNQDAVDVLRGLGRQSNRETALTIARLLQMHLGMPMGLPEGPIAPNSKVAADTAKRVFQWATGRAANRGPEVRSPAGSAWIAAPVDGPSLPGLEPSTPPPRLSSAKLGSSRDLRPRR